MNNQIQPYVQYLAQPLYILLSIKFPLYVCESILSPTFGKQNTK